MKDKEPAKDVRLWVVIHVMKRQKLSQPPMWFASSKLNIFFPGGEYPAIVAWRRCCALQIADGDGDGCGVDNEGQVLHLSFDGTVGYLPSLRSLDIVL